MKSNKSFTSQSCTIYRQSGGVCVKMQVFKQESMLRLEDMFSNMFGFRPKTVFLGSLPAIYILETVLVLIIV